MRDLSISRGTFDWGVSCPEEPVDGKPHVMYVWFDALINYLSGIALVSGSFQGFHLAFHLQKRQNEFMFPRTAQRNRSR